MRSFLLLLAATSLSLPSYGSASKDWIKALQKSVNELDAEYPGQFGLVVLNLKSDQEFSFRGGEKWYVASGIKVPVAIEVFRQIENGKLALDTLVELTKDDYIDGGKLNEFKAGNSFEVRYLLERMLINSDNTATDMLIRKVGLKEVNALAKPFGFMPITTLADVRRRIYEKIHPKANSIPNTELMKLGLTTADEDKLKVFESVSEVAPADWKKNSIEQAYIAYYAEGYNTASLKSYARVLKRLLAGELLKPESTKQLLDIMSRADTGNMRIKRGLPQNLTYAYKTGTQRKRLCDFGIVKQQDAGIAIVSACTRGLQRPDAEKLLAKLGTAITDSGVLKLEKVSNE